MTTAVKEKPIIFSAPMVRAILEGRKTQTRRLCKWVPREPGLNLGFSGLEVGHYCTGVPESGFVLQSRGQGGCWNDRTYPLHCPYGSPGTRLWVRENSRETTDIDGRPVLEYQAGGTRLIVDGAICHGEHRATSVLPRWRPSIHMPRWASRITLEISEVRVQRLQDISEEDAKAEGLVEWTDPPRVTAKHYGIAIADVWETDPRKAFARLWDSIHGKGAWELNPWLWVISFKRLTPTSTP